MTVAPIQRRRPADDPQQILRLPELFGIAKGIDPSEA
jgi:hypothetical protein